MTAVQTDPGHPMLTLDHLVIIAPSLELGTEHVRDRLGLDMAEGGRHPQMGTHNRLLRLGEACYLEVIAVDPDAPAPGRPRWFGLEDGAAVQAAWDRGQRLRAWVASTDDLDAVLARHGALFGDKLAISRGAVSWHSAVLPDGSLPAGGLAPPAIQWGPGGTPAPRMPETGARLRGFEVQHPEPDRVAAFYAELGIADAPHPRLGELIGYRAVIDTPAGPRTIW